MDEPITDSESLAEEPLSFNPYADRFTDEPDSGPTVTIVHHGGSEEVEGFKHIEEVDVEAQLIRVFYGAAHQDFYGATITEVSP